jgi:surface antigen
MRYTTKTARYIKVGVATAGLAAMAVTSACSPIATVTHSVATHSKTTKTTRTVANNPVPKYTSPSQTRVASTHNVLAPAITAYPWWNDQTGAADPYGMTKRQCVSFVAWYLNAHGTPFAHFTKGPKGVGTFGDGATWDAAAFKAGFTVSHTPLVGSIAQWHSNETLHVTTATNWFDIGAGAPGHVAIVTKVYPGGFVDLAQYNFGNNRSYNTMVKVKAPRYIYVPLASPHVP